MFSAEEIQSLNELEMEVYRYVMDHRGTIPYMRIRELANEAHVSTTTVLRFCKKLNCEGYSEFKFRMKALEGQQAGIQLADDKEEIDRFFSERLPSAAFQEKMEQVSSMMAKADHLLFFGVGSSLHVAQYAARCFTNVGKFSLCVSDPFYPTRLVPSISSMAVMLSVSGESQQLLEFARDLKHTHCPFISITSTSRCSLAKLADVSLTTGVHTQRRDSVDYTTQVPTLYLMEHLARMMGSRLLEP